MLFEVIQAHHDPNIIPGINLEMRLLVTALIILVFQVALFPSLLICAVELDDPSIVRIKRELSENNTNK